MIQNYIKKREEEFEKEFDVGVLEDEFLKTIVGGLLLKCKTFNRQSLLGLLDLLKEEVGKMKKEKQTAQGITMRTEIDDTLIDVYNQALTDVLKLITNNK